MPNFLGLTFKRNKSKTRSQMCLIITDDKRVIDKEIPVRIGCCVDDAVCSGWLLDGSNQMQDEATHNWYQIIQERSTIPICINKKWTLTDEDDATKTPGLGVLVDALFHESWVNDLVTMARDGREDQRKGWIILIFGISVAVVAVIIAAKAFNIGG